MPALPDGYTVRPATEADHPAIAALCGEVFAPHEQAAVTHLLAGGGYGPGRWTVATDPGGDVVSCCTLLVHTMRIGSTSVPAAQIEFVATRDTARRLGLVRAQFDVHHQWAAEEGALLLFITGIPYLYRRLGYGYAFDFLFELQLAVRPECPEGWEVAPATAADVAAIRCLDEAAKAAMGVAVEVPPASWAWLIAGAPTWEEEITVARRDGSVEGYARLQLRPEEHDAIVGGAASCTAAAQALVHHGADRAGDTALWVMTRPGNAWDAVAWAVGTHDPGRFNGVYGRVPDPVALLDHLRPELSARLAASPLAADAGELRLSFYEDGAILAYEGGTVTEVRRDPEPELDPLDHDRAGVPPDLLPALVLGRFGAAELERRYDDVGYVRDRALMDVLFPKLTADGTLPI